MNFRKSILIGGIILSTALIFAGCGSNNKAIDNKNSSTYPNKTIKIVNTLPEGAPPFQMTKKIADLISQKYGWKFEVVGNPGNSGADAVNAVWNAPHDGYTILGQTENSLGLSANAYTTHTTKDWRYFEMLQETSVLLIRADSPYKKVEDLINDAKNNPDKIKIGQPDEASSFDLKIRALEKVSGVKFEHKAFVGGTGIIDSLKNKEIDAVCVPMVIAKQGIEQGVARPIIVMDAEGFDFNGSTGKVNSIVTVYPEFKKYLPLDPVPGLAMPADTPKEVVDEFGKAFEEEMNGPEMGKFIDNIGAIKINLRGNDAKDYMSKMESNYVWLMKDFGMAKVDPTTLGIPRR